MHPRHQATRKQHGGKKGAAWSRKRADEDRGGITRKMSLSPGGASSEQKKQSTSGSNTTGAKQEEGCCEELGLLDMI